MMRRAEAGRHLLLKDSGTELILTFKWDKTRTSDNDEGKYTI